MQVAVSILAHTRQLCCGSLRSCEGGWQRNGRVAAESPPTGQTMAGDRGGSVARAIGAEMAGEIPGTRTEAAPLGASAPVRYKEPSVGA